jgi:hypothetical protein
VSAKAFAPRTGKGKAGGIDEHQIKPREQIARVLEQPLLDQVLDAGGANRGRAVLLALRQRLAKPRHGAVKLGQFEPVRRLDPVVLAPALGGTIGAAAHQPVQRGQKHRPFEIDLIPTRTRLGETYMSGAARA